MPYSTWLRQLGDIPDPQVRSNKFSCGSLSQAGILGGSFYKKVFRCSLANVDSVCEMSNLRVADSCVRCLSYEHRYVSQLAGWQVRVSKYRYNLILCP